MKKEVIVGLLILIIGIVILYKIINKKNVQEISDISEKENVVQVDAPIQKEKTIDDWRLTLVNYENILPNNYEVQLSNIDNIRQFDSRAIGDLNQMLKDMKKSGIKNVWVQSAYRSIEHQTELFDEKVDKYMEEGKTKEEAEKITLKTVNRPGTSEHNLGLAVDFNYVEYDFDTTKGFEWLQENAKNYGFILRYPKNKEEITKVDYEPWHWRYVGSTNAIKMNELNMCLEEYIEYLLK